MEHVTARSLLFGTALQTSLALTLALPAHAQPAPNARPTGGVVIGGSASISQTANNTAINQSSQRAAVNWQSFNVGSQQSVNFNQPSASAVTLNRVVGPDPSQIAGHINANGQVVLINQSGVTFYKGAQVNTNGLMVSAIGMSNQAVQGFMAGGKVVLDQPGNPNAAVVNDGNITVRQAGLAALVAPQVANHGTITAALGHVVLAGAKTATLDLYGDGLLSLDVTNQVTQVPVGKDGKPAAALVTNTGVIIADGGTVQLTARAADGIVQNLVDAGGRIRAATMGEQTGTIALNGVGGSIIVEGQLSATGRQPGTTGGAIEVVTDQNVVVAGTAKLNASGTAGGGTVAIGTTLARASGGPTVTPTLTAKNVLVANGATIAANATKKGNGGRVVVLSTSATEIAGQISAKGGANGGNGGFIETSGGVLGVTGSVDLGAPQGTQGTWLLDPVFLDIVGTAPGTEDVNFVRNGGTVLALDGLTGTPDTISNSIINSSTADVVLQAQQTLSVNANINLALAPNLSLTLEAGGTITVAPGITVNASGNVTLATGGAGTAPPPPPTAQPSPLISIGGTVTSGTGTVNLLSGTGGTIILGAASSVAAGTVIMNSGAGGITMNGAVGQAGAAVDITSAGPVSQSGSSTITASFVGSSGGVTGTVNLAGTKNAIAEVDSFVVTGGDLNVVTTSNLTLTGIQSANNLFYQVAQPAGTLTLGRGLRQPATLATGANGRISLVADNIVVGGPTSTITTTAGTVEVAPFSPIAANLLGSGGLVINAGLLSLINTNGGTLEIGGYTNAPLGTPLAASASSVDIGGGLNVASLTNANTLRLDATGDITESGGPLTVANLSGSGGFWTLNNGSNAIGALGNIVASDFSLSDTGNLAVTGNVAASVDVALDLTGLLTVNGQLNAPVVVLDANDIAIPGSLAAGTLAAIIGNTFNETGAMTVGTLLAVSSGAMTLTGNNQISTILGVSAPTFALNDNSDLLISSVIIANNIRILDPNHQITLGDGAVIATGGNTRPAGPIQPALEPANGAPGAYLQAASFAQIGTSFLFGSTTGPNTVQIATTSNAQFDPPAGLFGIGTWLILNTGNSTASGNVFVDALDVLYGTPGSATLSGTIAGIGGGPAAALGFIQPGINANYTFNGCVIAAAVCGTLPPTPPPTTQLTNSDITSALGGLYPFLPGMPGPQATLARLVVVALPMLPAAAPQLTDSDVVPPNISYLDY